MTAAESTVRPSTIWYCEGCQQVSLVQVADKSQYDEADLMVFDQAHKETSPECVNSVRMLRSPNLEHPGWRQAVPKWALPKIEELLVE